MDINDWKTIQMQNDIKLIKRRLKVSTAANWSIVFDVFLILLAFVIDRSLAGKENTIENLNCVWAIIALLGILIPILILCYDFISAKQKTHISLKVSNSKDLVSLFDDEICYQIMSAETFCTSLENNCSAVDCKQKALLQEFYFIEASYYLNKSVTLFERMDNNLSNVIEKDLPLPNRLTKNRLINAIHLIDSIYDTLFRQVGSQNHTLSSYDIHLDTRDLKSHHDSLVEFVNRNNRLLGTELQKREVAMERN